MQSAAPAMSVVSVPSSRYWSSFTPLFLRIHGNLLSKYQCKGPIKLSVSAYNGGHKACRLFPYKSIILTLLKPGFRRTQSKEEAGAMRQFSLGILVPAAFGRGACQKYQDLCWGCGAQEETRPSNLQPCSQGAQCRPHEVRFHISTVFPICRLRVIATQDSGTLL